MRSRESRDFRPIKWRGLAHVTVPPIGYIKKQFPPKKMSQDGTIAPLPSRRGPVRSRRQGIYWLGTLAYDGPSDYSEPPSWPYGLPEDVAYIKGQLEQGSSTGYLHWQVLFVWKRKVSLGSLQQSFLASGHYELSRSTAADTYVWKEDTRIAGTQFELGAKPIRRNSQQDWDSVWQSASEGRLLDIPAQIRVIKKLNLGLSL